MLSFPIPAVGVAASLGGAAVILAWRVRETQRPITARAILIPPLAMSTGFSMFIAPAARVPIAWAATAFLAGLLVLSYPLARTSSLVRQGDQILLQRSRAFLVILLGLVAIRLVLRGYVSQLLSPTQTAGLFFVLAFGMIVRWRASMYLQYRRLLAGATIAR